MSKLNPDYVKACKRVFSVAQILLIVTNVLNTELISHTFVEFVHRMYLNK